MSSGGQVLDQVRHQAPMSVIEGKTSHGEQSSNDDNLAQEDDEASNKNLQDRPDIHDSRTKVATSTAAPTTLPKITGTLSENDCPKEQVTPSSLKKRDQKLRVVLPNEQKTLVTPTIIAGDSTPSQLFNSLVQLSGHEVGLFTGLPTYTPGSADALATMNPFFWGVPTFSAPNGDLHNQVADSFMVAAAAAADHQVISQKHQQEKVDELGKSAQLGTPDQASDSSNRSAADRRPPHKFSFDNMQADSDNNGFQYILASPYLFLSPEHDALLRLGLSNHLQQHPLANKTAPPSQLTVNMGDTLTPANPASTTTLPQPVTAYISNRSNDDSTVNQNQQQQQQHNVYHRQQLQYQQQQQQQQQQHDQIHISAKDLTNQVVAHQQQRVNNIVASSPISTGKPTAPTTLSHEAQVVGASPSPYQTYQQNTQVKVTQVPNSNQQQYTLSPHRPLIAPTSQQLDGSSHAIEPNKILAANFAIATGGNFHPNQINGNQVPRVGSQFSVDPATTPQYIYHHQHQIEAAHNPASFSNNVTQASAPGKPTEDGILKVAGPPVAHHQHSPLLVMGNDSGLGSSEYHHQIQNIPASMQQNGALAMHYDSTARPLYDEQLRRLYMAQQHQQSVLQPTPIKQGILGPQTNGLSVEQPPPVAGSDSPATGIAQNQTLVKNDLQQSSANVKHTHIQRNKVHRHQAQVTRESVSSSNSLSSFGVSSPRRPDQSSSACSSVSRDASASIDVTAIPSRTSTLDGTQSDGSTYVATSSFKGAVTGKGEVPADGGKFNGKSAATTTTTATTTATTVLGPDGVVKKKSKGGRKKKPVTHEELMARKNRCKERNRVAAKRCRQKRKQFLDELHGRIDELNNVNKKLQRENTMLKSELDLLRKQQQQQKLNK